jgi:DNA-directed RNA polymerase alpha subunit
MRHYIFANGVDLQFDEVNDGVFVCVVGSKEMLALVNYNYSEHEQSIVYLELSTRATNVLRAENIQTIGQLIGRLKDSDYYLSRLYNCGKVTEHEIKNALKERGLSWGQTQC